MESSCNSTPLWQRDESLKQAGLRLSDSKSGVRVVSFDFFDTLVSRTCAEPNDLFVEVGRRLATRGLLQRALTPMEFFSVRIAADERARKNAARAGRFPEIKLANIYAELTQVVTDVAAACQVEFDVEREYIFVNPATASLAQHARQLGYKLAVISDTYFTGSQLRQLLDENGLSTSLFDTFLVSCERGKAKWNGQLFQELFRHFDIHPGELLHFGDNMHADIHASRQFGVQAVHYYKTNPRLDRSLAGEKKLRSSNFYPAGSLDSVRILTARRAEDDQDAFRDGAFVFGPVLARYADWCVERFKSANTTTVLALMREGELLGELVRRSAIAAKVDLRILPCFTSRRATARASLSEISPASALELLEGGSVLTLQSILDVLGLGFEISSQFEPSQLKKVLPTRESVNEVLKLLFETPRVVQLIEAGRKESFSLAFEYLSSLAGSATQIGILDIGWGGSIQRNIARILRLGGRTIRTIGCYLARTRKSGRLMLDGDEAHAFMEQEWARSTILPELAVSSAIGSTNGYERLASGAVSPVLGDYALAPNERKVKEQLREGILEFQALWLELRTRKNYSTETLADIDQQIPSMFYRLLEFPDKPEAERLGVLTHDENYFGENFSAPLCDDQSARFLRSDGIQAVYQSARCYWPQGVVARNHPRLVHSLSCGWSDYLSLGRFGAFHGTPIGQTLLTDEEVCALGTLIRALALRQVILIGPLSPALMEVFRYLWRQDDGSTTPKLLVAGQPDLPIAPSDLSSNCVLISGDIEDPRTIGRLRSELMADANAGLVLSGDLSEPNALSWINGLAPFLGHEGAILTACGRFDRNTLQESLPAARWLNAWLNENGNELGFSLWNGTAGLQSALCNWIVARRTPAKLTWNNQWMFTAADLLATDAAEDSLLAKA